MFHKRLDVLNRSLVLLTALALSGAAPVFAHGPRHATNTEPLDVGGQARQTGEAAAAMGSEGERPGAPGQNSTGPGGPRLDEEGRAARLWGCPMCETVRQDSPGTCPRCGMELVRMEPPRRSETWGCTTDEAVRQDHPGVRIEKTKDPREGGSAGTGDGSPRANAAAGPSRPLMPGVPNWLFYTIALLILALSFVLFEVEGRRRARSARRRLRFDFMRLPGLARLLGRPWFRLSLQLPIVTVFVLILCAGLFGNPAPERNIAPVLTWTIWWTCLALVILLLGKVWCTVCPWMAIAEWLAKLGFRKRRDGTVGLGKRWPKRLRNIWIATLMFVFLTWLELGYGITESPFLTALLGLAMVGLGVATVLVFERKAFCRYACLVGRVSGLYSMFASTELRARDKDLCRACATKDCFHGSAKGEACPTGQYLGAMDTNTYCILCMECVRTCPSENIAISARAWGADLVESNKARVDEAYLAVMMLSMSAFHGLTMTPAWDRIVKGIGRATGWGWLASFSLGMAGMLALPLAAYNGLCVLSRWLARDRERSARVLFVRFAYSLLPIALFYHLAHNLQHIFFEGKKLVRASSDPFGWGWNLLGTAHMPIDAVLPVEVGWALQVALVIVGHVYGILIAHRIAVSLYPDRSRATASQIPMLAGMLLFSFQSLWLLAQPMMMRTAM